MTKEEIEFQDAINLIISSKSRKKLVVAGPGTGKTYLFKQVLEASKGDREDRLVLTFINNLKNDLEEHLSDYAKVFTLHGYCLGLLYRYSELRIGLSSKFQCQPGLATLIQSDWEHIMKSGPPHFVQDMRNLNDTQHLDFYFERGDYYDAVDFDDTVYRVLKGLTALPGIIEDYDLILVDEYQDFNRLEASIINILAENNPIIIVGDDDQALYSQLRNSSWNYIRSLYGGGDFELFDLPYCLRCPEVIVQSVNDVILKAQELGRLGGRISKPFKHFPPLKGEDSEKYPKIFLIETSVQRDNANYMGRYISYAITQVPSEEIETAQNEGYPAFLVIASDPYRSQIIKYLQAEGFSIDTRRDIKERLTRLDGLELLKLNPESNLGWRIILEYEPSDFVKSVLSATVDGTTILNCLSSDYKEQLMAEVATYEPESQNDVKPTITRDDIQNPTIKVASFEGAKGLSAQHIFIAGLHNGDIPRNPRNIQDIEICRFIVGLTRTRKKCTLIHTRRFADQFKQRSDFVSWIKSDRIEYNLVDSSYWRCLSSD